jgi:uncharacterized protein (TIGR03546 family)
MNPLSLLSGLARALQGGADPRHLAAGLALGAAWGLTPKGNALSIVFLLLFFFFRVDKGLALVSAFLFTFVGHLIDPAAHALGLALLTAAPLKGLWTALYDLPLAPLTRFNNSVVLGNLVIGLALFAPLYAAGKRLAVHYQANWQPRLARLPLIKTLTGLRVYQWYDSLRQP